MTESSLRLVADFPPLGRQAWREVVDRDLKGASFEKRVVTKLYEGLDVQPLYLPDDWPAREDASGLPGQPPHTRGFAALPPARGWTAMQRYAHPDAAVVSEHITQELSSGGDAIWLKLAARAASSAATATGESGMVVNGLADLEQALEAVALEKTAVSLSAGNRFFEAAATLVALWDKRGVTLNAAKGAFNADPIGELAQAGGSAATTATLVSRLAELALVTSTELPEVTAVCVSTAPYSAAGATAVQELAAALSTGATYLKAMESAGLPVERAAQQFVVELPLGCDQFLEIAKLRALRATWGAMLSACGISAEHQKLKVHATTASRMLTVRDPWVNMLRTTVSCFAAAVGGADVISVSPYDSLIGPSDELGRRVARNTQTILKEESHLAKVADPSGGCWYVERLTAELAEAAWKEFQDIERRGGIVQVLQDGSFAAAIEQVRQKRSLNAARRKDPITGVSEFANVSQEPLSRKPADFEQIATASLQRLEQAKAAGLDEALKQAHAAAPAQRLKATARAARLGASFEQLASQPAAEDTPVAPLPGWRVAAAFEALRDASDAALVKTGRRPLVFLANLGPIAHHTARAMFAQNFFEAGGFEVLSNNGFPDAAAAAKALKASGAPLAVICSSDRLYETMVQDVAPALKAAGVDRLMLAGRPGEHENAYRLAGVDGFIFIGCNVLDELTRLLRAQGVL